VKTAFFSLLRLETQFPRPVGDSANPSSHQFPVRIAVIADATVDRVVYAGSVGLVERFVEVAKAQVDLGAIAVGTSCGFLFEHQAVIQAQLSVPFISSSLTWLVNTAASATPAVLTFDADVLCTAPWFKAIAPNAIVLGLDAESYLYQVIKRDELHLDMNLACDEVVSRCHQLVKNYAKQLGRAPKSVLFECTNLGPYKAAAQKALYDNGYDCTLIDYNDVIFDCWRNLQKETR
jgi:hypothetical protein